MRKHIIAKKDKIKGTQLNFNFMYVTSKRYLINLILPLKKQFVNRIEQNVLS